MATKKAMRGPVDDHDDAHFSDNPAVRKPKRGGRGKKKMSGRKSSKR